ncbi:glycosyltransferase family 87 protein [Phenylobacterium sp. LjRoot225]
MRLDPIRDLPAFLRSSWRLIALSALFVMLAFASLSVFSLIKFQAAGADYSCFWAGAKTALSEPAYIYDFHHNTALQGWPLGPGRIRPYIYPPTALFVFIPFALTPYWIGYGLWIVLSGILFFWAAARTGAPWAAMLFMPAVALVIYCGQVTFAVGGLVLAGLALRDRSILAGMLFGLAACIKPQLVILVPIALLAEMRWRTLAAAGMTGLVLSLAATLVWGPQVWRDWLTALPRFNELIFNDRALTGYAITPYAALVTAGHRGAWALLLAPVAVAMVWFGFRRTQDLPDRSLLLFGATILVTPYAMTYEFALFAPGAAVYLTRLRDPRWPRYAAAFLGYMMLPTTFPTVLLAFVFAVAPLIRPQLARDNASHSRQPI